MPRPAVFFDRDDTLIRTTGVAPQGDLGDPELVQPLPGAADALRTVRDLGYFVGVITNQGGVARGRYTPENVDRVHDRLQQLVGNTIDDFRFCPYHPRGTVPAYTREHPWRKPAPGMILDMSKAHDLDLARSWMVGDAVRDCEAGKSAGCRTILIDESNSEPAAAIDFIAPDIAAAVRIIGEHRA